MKLWWSALLIWGILYVLSKDKQRYITYDREEPDAWIVYNPDTTITHSNLKDSLISNERRIVDSLFNWQDSIILEYNGLPIEFCENDFYDDLETYQGQNICNIDLYTWQEKLMSRWREEYMEFIATSRPALKKIIDMLDIRHLTKEEKIKSISLFLQQKQKTMQYRHDISPIDYKRICYMRKPWVSLLHGMVKDWYYGDCEDATTNFIALCLEAWIPEEDLYICFAPWHAYNAISWDIDPAALDSKDGFIYIDPAGGKIIPNEVTTPANMNIIEQRWLFWNVFLRDTTYTRRETFGHNFYSKNQKITFFGKCFPNWFTTTWTD